MSDDEHMGLPAPSPQMVRDARAYLTPRYAVGVEVFLWEAMELPLPDSDAIGAVIAASAQAQRGAGDQPQPMEVAAALLLLGTVRLVVDQMEARLLNVAQASALGWEQIAAILDVSAEEAEGRYRRLKPRLDEPVAEAPLPRPRGVGAVSRPAHRASRSAPRKKPPRRSPSGASISPWDELEDPHGMDDLDDLDDGPWEGIR